MYHFFNSRLIAMALLFHLCSRSYSENFLGSNISWPFLVVLLSCFLACFLACFLFFCKLCLVLSGIHKYMFPVGQANGPQFPIQSCRNMAIQRGWISFVFFY